MSESVEAAQAKVNEFQAKFSELDEQIAALKAQRNELQEGYGAAIEEYELQVREARLAEVGSNGEQVVAVNTATEEGEAANG